MSRILIMCLAASLLVLTSTRPGLGEPPKPIEIFNQRIMPIFRSPNPSSCVQCHLSSVDLKQYILPSPEQTFASLRDQALINVDAPETSKILTLIKMGEKDLDKGAKLIHDKTRRAEYDAFAAWIRACCDDPHFRSLPKVDANAQAGPDRPLEVIRHARKSRVVDSFVRNVWSQRMRCFPCHTPHEIDASNPRHQAARKTMKEFKRKFGDEFVERLKIFRATPEATVQYIVEASRDTPAGELPLVNLASPRDSLLVLKPTSKLPAKRDDGTLEAPSSGKPVTHLGGLKMHPDDQSYKSFMAWIQDYANVVGDRYVAVEDLPADNWHGTKLVLQMTAAPATWPVGTPVQLFVYAWNDAQQSWDSEPTAFTQGTITPRRMVNGALFQLTNHKSGEPRRQPSGLARGNYLIRVFVALEGRLNTEPALLLDDTACFGEGVIENAKWREGFRRAEVLAGDHLKRHDEQATSSDE